MNVCPAIRLLLAVSALALGACGNDTPVVDADASDIADTDVADVPDVEPDTPDVEPDVNDTAEDLDAEDADAEDVQADTDVDDIQEDAEPDAPDNVCERVPVTPERGIPCETAEDCGGGLCADDWSGERGCQQLCVPERCTEMCGEGETCPGMVDTEGNPVFLEEGVLLGVCFGAPETVPDYDPCGPGVGVCSETATCLPMPGVSETPWCAPACASSLPECPPREGISASCTVGTGGSPTHCALVCDEANGGTEVGCPDGMTCASVPGGAICVW